MVIFGTCPFRGGGFSYFASSSLFCTVNVMHSLGFLFKHSVHLSFDQVPRYVSCLGGRAAVVRLCMGNMLEMFSDIFFCLL